VSDLEDALRRAQEHPLRNAVAKFLPVFRRSESPPLVWRRSWHPAIDYEPGDVVEHNDSSYVAALPSIGAEPPALEWDVLARGKRGAGGISGANGAPGPQGPPGSNTVDVEDEGAVLGSFGVFNFVGDGVTAVDVGGGQTDIAIPGGASDHDLLSGVSPDDHHPQAHTHPAEGAVVVSHASTTGQTANDHHNQAHDQADHDRAEVGDIAAVAALAGAGTSVEVPNADHVHAHGTGYLPDAHHPQAHDIDGADHIGYPGGTTTFLRADGVFAAPPGGGGSSDEPISSSWMGL
jgi:hypothetical protein